MHPPDKRGIQTQCTRTGNRIGNRATRRLNPGFHRGIQNFTAILFDQLHDALFNAHQFQKTVIGLRNHVHNGISDAGQLVGFHRFLSSNSQRSRMIQVGHCGLRALQ